MRRSELRKKGQYGNLPTSKTIIPPRAREVMDNMDSQGERIEDFQRGNPDQRQLELAAMNRKHRRSDQVRRDRKRRIEAQNKSLSTDNASRRRRSGDIYKLGNTQPVAYEKSDGTIEYVERQAEPTNLASANSVGLNPSPHSLIPSK